MTTVSINELQRDILIYINLVKNGETVRILDQGHPVADIKRSDIQEASTFTQEPINRRGYGIAKGEFVVPDSFFDPLPDDLLKLFNGE